MVKQVLENLNGRREKKWSKAEGINERISIAFRNGKKLWSFQNLEAKHIYSDLEITPS